MAVQKKEKTAKSEVKSEAKVKEHPAMSEEKRRALELAISSIEKTFGKGSIMKLGDGARNMNVDVISTGCLTLDLALGIGGLPRGRIVEIYGPESSGKTTVSLHCIAETQKAGGTAAFIDAEHALDPVYAAALGVSLDNLYISQPDNGEQALAIAESLIRSGAIDMLVVDSVAALTPRAEIEGQMGDSHVGLQARLMSQALRKLTGFINKSNACVIFINQLREKIGVSYGNPEVTTGGKALKFYSSVRMEVRKGESLKDGTDQTGARTKVKIVKNKLAPPFKTAEFDILYGEGISAIGCILDLAVENGFVEKSGSWFSCGGERIGQGREAAKAYLKEHSDMAADLENKIRNLGKNQKEQERADEAAEETPADEVTETITEE